MSPSRRTLISITRSDIIIVGAGPAGSATALRLASRRIGLAHRVLVLDAAEFPRPKLCGGGITPEAERLLGHLEVEKIPPSVPIREVHFLHGNGTVVRVGESLFRVVRREEFDAGLLADVRARGVRVLEGERVLTIDRDSDRVHLTTGSGRQYEAQIVIGADGAHSQIRRALVGSVRCDRLVALEILTPQIDGEDASPSSTAVFDFRPAERGLHGYSWDFPCLKNGRLWMNRGLVGLARSSPTPLRDHFERALLERGIPLDSREIEAAGAPVYDPDRPQSADRTLLVGDAVGIDPWFGEGISVALGTGIIAAHAAAEALDAGDFRFPDHARRIRKSAVGESLLRRRAAGRMIYTGATRPDGLAGLLGLLGNEGST